MSIYLDNAATTLIDEEVREAMFPYMTKFWGNPSSLHSYGRQAKSGIEKARKQIATLLNVMPSEIFFTASGTEGNNMLLKGCIATHNINHVITSPLEHDSVRIPLIFLAKKGTIQLDFVAIDQQGVIQYDHLEELLKKNTTKSTLVSIMHANHEIGNIYNINHIGEICADYKSVFHSDTIQTMGKYDFKTFPMQLAVGTAHKFHGPKGAGFVYINSATKISSFIHGGMQEIGMRGGTENVAGIVGLAKALEVAYRDQEKNREHVSRLKNIMIKQLQEKLPFITFNGASADLEKSIPTLLNIQLPKSDKHDMLLFNLDIRGIAASAGSACTSGSVMGSQVLTALNKNSLGAVRFSFSKYTTIEEINYTVNALAKICNHD